MSRNANFSRVTVLDQSLRTDERLQAIVTVVTMEIERESNQDNNNNNNAITQYDAAWTAAVRVLNASDGQYIPRGPIQSNQGMNQHSRGDRHDRHDRLDRQQNMASLKIANRNQFSQRNGNANGLNGAAVRAH